MKRRHFIGALAATTVSTAWAAETNSPTTPAVPSLPLVRTPLVLMAPRADGLEAVWAVNRSSKGRLEWESADGEKGHAGMDAFGFVPQDDGVLRVRLAGLKPGTAYRVRSVTTAADNDETVTSAWKNFRTLNPLGDKTRFVVWNDTHINNPTIQKLHEVTPTADFLVWNGDTCNDWTKEELLVPTLLHPGERDITDGRPLFLTWGNHDVRGPRAFRVASLVATPEGRPFYTFRSGPVAAICLHTGEDKPDAHPGFRGRVAFEALRAEQAKWLAEIIRRPEFRDAPYRVIFCHIPLRWRNETLPDYSKGGFDHFSERSRTAWHDSLVAWKTQLIISGHTHSPGWFPANEQFPYGQLVGGGPLLKAATWMEGTADARTLNLKVRSLAGEQLYEVSFPPVG
jgi:predicted phosphodiesterase